jgi:hypothetical protein
MEKRGRGRPPLDDARIEDLHAKVSLSDLKNYGAAAKRAGETLSTWVKGACDMRLQSDA